MIYEVKKEKLKIRRKKSKEKLKTLSSQFYKNLPFSLMLPSQTLIYFTCYNTKFDTELEI
jgi:hypothetical protein